MVAVTLSEAWAQTGGVQNSPGPQDMRQNAEGTDWCQCQLEIPMLTAKVVSYVLEGKDDARGKRQTSFSPLESRHQLLALSKSRVAAHTEPLESACARQPQGSCPDS